MNLQSFKSLVPISGCKLNTHRPKRREDVAGYQCCRVPERNQIPLITYVLACMFGDFRTWQCSHRVKILELELGT